ncbi:intracellular protein transport protein USO1-like isoform X2 [Penaeus chinensis]|uniref:intracellular protein transport protein USO1-like isoform X2 n=1 Tax=Penaeus chinensis TaxID=139456 RepID=UPI001FB7A346|nr:intracellular protein transport protein USO1-like isoform X2 [Penaeus chinensis]
MTTQSSNITMYGNNNNNGSMKNGGMGEEEPIDKDVSVDRSTLEAYIKLEREIAEEEASNPLQPLELKSEQLAKITQEIKEMEVNLENLERETAKEKEDVDALETGDVDIKTTLLEMGNSFDDQMAKEKAEYLAALNKQEIASQELESHRKQRDQLAEEVAELEERASTLQAMYKTHDELLSRIFGGEYGSVMENQLEAELDELEAHRARIMEANFKWRQAQMMLEYACKQLAVAVQKWQDLPTIPTIDLEIRYSVAAETRNNLVAASQNINGAQRYLDNVNFPYCAPEEVDTLNKATEYVFTDMQSQDRHEHAHTCYSTTHKRANALLQWFDTVINTTIMKDLQEINEKVKEKTLELRRERVRLIQDKVRELWGTDIELDGTLRGAELDLEQLSKANLTDGQVVKLEGNELEGDRASTPPPLSDDELAPLPSNSIIFGNMYDHYQNQLDDLAKQHQQEMETFIREQEMNSKRISENLQDKLMARRQRRARMRIEEKQKTALTQ